MDYAAPRASVRSSKGKAPMRAIDTQPPSTKPSTFFDDPTPIERSYDDLLRSGDSRDSHDLSLALDGSRNSVVDHMLLSLDALPNGSSAPTLAIYGDFHPRDPATSPARPTNSVSPAGRRRGHTHTGSRSSDFDLHVQDAYTPIAHRRRRPSDDDVFGKRQPTRESHYKPNYGFASVEAGGIPFGAGPFGGHQRGSGKKGSQGSTRTVDAEPGPVRLDTALASRTLGLPNRKNSFDFGNTHSFSDQRANNPSVMGRGRPIPGGYWHSDSAPEPFVPAGPLKKQESMHSIQQADRPMHPPMPAYEPPEAPTKHPKRRSSMRSTSGRMNRKCRADTPRPDTSETARSVPETIYHTGNNLELNSNNSDPLTAPSPSAGYRKTRTAVPNDAQPAPKEKTGFFRRVFGSSKQTQPPPPPTSAQDVFQNQNRLSNQTRQRTSTPSHPSDSASDRERPKTHQGPGQQAQTQHIASQMKSVNKKDAAPEVPPVPAEHQQAPLNKKPSSFFRRRRNKSISEKEPSRPPVTFLQQHPKLTVQAAADLQLAQSSPSISSLRKVMNPYLSDALTGQASPAEQVADGQETQTAAGEPLLVYGQTDSECQEKQPTGFSPGYVPHKDATIRSVVPNSPLANETIWGDSNTQVPLESPRLRVKLRKNRPQTRTGQEDTFLADSSGNEERNSTKLSPTTVTFGGQHEDGQRPRTSPNQPSFPSSGKEDAVPSRRPPLKKQRSEIAQGTRDRQRMLSPITDGSPVSPDFRERSESPKTQGDEWLKKSRAAAKLRLKTRSSRTSDRVWLNDDSDDAQRSREASPLSLPIEGERDPEKPTDVSPLSPASAEDVFQSATSLPIVQVDDDEVREADSRHKHTMSHGTVGTAGSVDPVTKTFAAESVAIDTDSPTLEDRQRAAQMFAGDESFIRKDRAAGWLGETSFVSARTRKAFMELFDWTGLSILNAFRELCGRLIVRAESQQLDRIIDAFSKRWCVCNPRNGFKTNDVVHMIAFSILMLNTDLHLADMDSKMTRNEFVRNTLPTLRRTAEASLTAAENTTRAASPAHPPKPSLNLSSGDHPESPTQTQPPEKPAFQHSSTEPLPGRQSSETKRTKNRLSLLPPGLDLAASSDSVVPDNCNVLVNKPHEGSMKSWESQVEIALREFYNSIRQLPLPLHGTQTQGSNLSTAGNSVRRTPSMLSKAPSETAVSFRGRNSEMRSQTSRWAGSSKTRSRPRLYPTSTIGSSRTSLDDQSVWSPAGSSTWSKHSLGKSMHGGTNPSSWTTAGMSVESFGSGFAAGEGGYQQSIGFANALSQAIIREEHAAMGANPSEEEFGKIRPLLEDESLELRGAPWAKEGLVKHKHHLEALDKRAKDRNWSECFAVVEKGYLRMFSFPQNSKSMRNRAKGSNRGAGGHVVGGGNWYSQAENLGCFLLRQTIASSLPPPGYSKQRPHVWALSLPNGAVHLFQVGTDEICAEFVKTANYWSARLSKEPLVGGVSNIEYGWGDNVINTALINQRSSTITSASTSAVQLPRPSMQSSIRDHVRSGSVDDTGVTSTDRGTGTIRARLPGDKVTISEWTPPVQSMMASQLMEVDQLKALTAYVKAVEEDLDRHNGLRQPMGLAFSPRHPNGQKALANWERKSAYLLKEIVKFKTYINCLTEADALKEKVYQERELREKEIRDASTAAAASGGRVTPDTGGSALNGLEADDDDLASPTAEAVRRAESREAYLDD